MVTKQLIKSTIEVRIDNIESVKAFQEEMRQEAEAKGYQLSSYSWTEKEVKSKGEVIDSYFLVKYICLFNDPKVPESINDHVEFHYMESGF